MTEEQFEGYKQELNNFLKITEQNVMSKNFEMISFYQRYLDIYLKEVKILQRLSNDFDELKAKKHHYYKFSYQYKLSSLTEIETACNGDKEIILLSQKMNEQENYVKFLERSLNSIKDISYVVKNFLEYKKIMMGD